jgi:glycosyltransferase involved in cell wall biosynthesis
MSRIDAIICNSHFTESHLDPRLTSRSVVIYPPVDTGPLMEHTAKTNIVLSVGRFHNLKKQSVMIEAFAELTGNRLISGWELVLAGSVLPADRPYLKNLKKLAKNLPIRFEVDISSDRITALYRSSRIYWHAAGHGERDPVRFEHFGISAVEAMAAGCVPVVFAGGGLPEIITDGSDGFLWHDTVALKEKTVQLMKDRTLADNLSAAARRRSSEFDTRHFKASVRELLERIGG